jgi:hypothetical protein
MSKRKFDEDLEDYEGRPVETKRHKTEDTRQASMQVLMNRNIVGSVLAPFLRTADLNSLMRACKTLVTHLNTNPEAWSPALFINRPVDLPLFFKQDQAQKNFLSKVSPTKLKKIMIDTTRTESTNMDNLYTWSIALSVVAAKQRPLDELVLIDFRGDTDFEIRRWNLYAKTMTLIENVSFGRHDINSNYLLPSVIEEWDCSLQRIHLHARIIAANKNIRRLKLDASFPDEDDEDCSVCEERPSSPCFPMYMRGIEHLDMQLGRVASGEGSSVRWKLQYAVGYMPSLKKLVLHGTTDRPQAWLTDDINHIRAHHPNGSTMEIDVSNLQVPKVVVLPEFVPFVLPPLK